MHCGSNLCSPPVSQPPCLLTARWHCRWAGRFSHPSSHLRWFQPGTAASTGQGPGCWGQSRHVRRVWRLKKKRKKVLSDDRSHQGHCLVPELQHVLESTGGSDVRFRQFGGLFLIFLVLLSFAAQDWRCGGWRHGAVAWRLYVWVLNIHRGHVKGTWGGLKTQKKHII